jgi:hypothetical protein
MDLTTAPGRAAACCSMDGDVGQVGLCLLTWQVEGGRVEAVVARTQQRKAAQRMGMWARLPNSEAVVKGRGRREWLHGVEVMAAWTQQLLYARPQHAAAWVAWGFTMITHCLWCFPALAQAFNALINRRASGTGQAPSACDP